MVLLMVKKVMLYFKINALPLSLFATKSKSLPILKSNTLSLLN